MPVTRRRRATSPEQPENTNTAAQTPEQAVGSPAEVSAVELSTTEQAPSTEISSLANPPAEPATTQEPAAPFSQKSVEAESSPVVAQETSNAASEISALPGGNDANSSSHSEHASSISETDESTLTHQHSEPSSHVRRSTAARAAAENIPYQPLLPSVPTNGDRLDRQDYSPTSIESGRRTSRGELFRRPPQPPVQPAYSSPVPPPPPVVPQPPQLQPPSHEISLPLGNLLHLAYNPGYTGSEEARSVLLHQLENESKTGGRARCWSCGSLAIVYDRWNTRSKTFGEIGIAFCEICGVWSVM